ncbi:MAG: aminotransferase class V-fold PLP-dependent enzyme [Ezakiella sp.]|nr:aminotransferase class V-fold PLP-dependent enzyme [Ezakiella sp.]MDD7762241.1 aminotransferase class V-fold PLP-dependent enzyme [Bacillota bacterium]MDY3947261.1 aminotransferase class V-fold PLP-dependent enzyme [Ezakiella sp.]
MIYFDNGATSFPKPPEVLDAYIKASGHAANPGRSSHKMAIDSARAIFETRLAIKDFINADSTKNIIFTKNCTEALDIAIFGALSAGDHVITTSFEHNSVLRPLHHLKNQGVELSIIDSDFDELERDIIRAIKPNTRMVAISHVDNLVGHEKDIVSIGNSLSEDILFLVDAAQSLGHTKVDVEEARIDLLAAPGHKALMGPMGTGFLYIRDENMLTPFLVGGTGSESQSLMQPSFAPDKFEAGTLNMPGIYSLKAGIDWINKTGLDKIEGKVKTLARYFYNRVREVEDIIIYGIDNPDDITSVVSINIEGIDCGLVAQKLDEYGEIAVRSQLHCAPLNHMHFGTIDKGMVRFSFGYFNTQAEIDQAIEVLKRISHEAREGLI